MRASKGLLFSLMVFLLLGSLMALRSASEHNQGALGAGLSESYAFRRVSDKYANVSKNLTDLTGNEAEKSVDQRILPFTYGLDGNAISVSFEVPVNSERVQNYIETLSAFRVFMEDTNYGKEYDSMRTDINTLNPVDWGGEDRIVSFVTEPDCLNFSLTDSNFASFSFPCSANAYTALRRTDINVTLTSVHDFNSLSCDFAGSSSCPNLDFNSLNPQPYISITYVDTNCSKCAIAQRTVRSHYNPPSQNFVSLRCSGALCASSPIDINFSTSLQIGHTGLKAGIEVVMDLNSEIGAFEFNDANMLVADDYFGSKRWSG